MPTIPSSSPEILSGVMEIIAQLGNVTGLTPDQDYYDAGVTSVMALPILLEIEDRFQVGIPDDAFVAARSSRAIADIVANLQSK